MYIKGASRRSIKFWSRHLKDLSENDRADIVDSRGLASEDLADMMREMQKDAAFTRAENFMYIASFNPCEDEFLTEKQWERAFEIFEKHRGIPEGQQRIVVEHEKNGRIHRHVVWNRIDLENMRAFPDGLDLIPCEAAEIQIEKELGLRRTPNLLDRDPEDGDPTYSPKPYEMFRGMKSGIDARDIKEEITRLYQQSEDALEFVQALREHGYEFVRGNRAFCILDAVGDEHSLARQIKGVNTKQLRTFLKDIDLSNAPMLEDAREIIRARLDAERIADRETVKDHIDWEDRLQQSAIEKEKVQRNFIEPIYNQSEDTSSKKVKEDERPKPKPNAPHLSRTSGEIRLAYVLTDTGKQFADALEDRGLILACITEKDATRLNRWEKQRIKEQWEAPVAKREEWMAQRGGVEQLSKEQLDQAQHSFDKWMAKDTGKPKRMSFHKYVQFVQGKDEEREEGNSKYQRYSVGELVVVDQYGRVHQLNFNNTADTFDERAKHLKNIDRSELLSVSAADSALQKMRSERRQETQELREQRRDHIEQLKQFAAQHPEILDFAVENEDYKARRRGRDALMIHHAFDASNEPTLLSKTFRVKALIAALDDFGISLARVTKEEAQRSHMDAEFVRAVGNRPAPVYQEGEIVAVTLRGNVHRLDDHIVNSPDILRKGLAALDHTQLGGIKQTKEYMAKHAIELGEKAMEERLFRATHFDDLRMPFIRKGKFPAIHRPINAALGGVTGAISKIGDLIEGLLGFFLFDSPAPKQRAHGAHEHALDILLPQDHGRPERGRDR